MWRLCLQYSSYKISIFTYTKIVLVKILRDDWALKSGKVPFASKAKNYHFFETFSSKIKNILQFEDANQFFFKSDSIRQQCGLQIASFLFGSWATLDLYFQNSRFFSPLIFTRKWGHTKVMMRSYTQNVVWEILVSNYLFINIFWELLTRQ